MCLCVDVLVYVSVCGIRVCAVCMYVCMVVCSVYVHVVCLCV